MPRRVAALLAAAGAVTSLLGCGTESESGPAPAPRYLVTQVPAGEARLHPEPGVRFPPGSRIVMFDAANERVPPLSITDGLVAAGAPSVSLDGRRVLFVGREEGSDSFFLYSSAIDGSKRRRLVGAPHDCGAGAELPDGRIVVSAADGASPPPPGLDSAWSLFVFTPKEGTVERITFAHQTELDPFVLADGRILYSQWLPAGDGRDDGGSFALFTVHPDGTGVAPIHGHHEGPVWKLRARQGENGDLFFLAADGNGGGSLRGALWSAPAGTGFTLPLPAAVPLAAEPLPGDRLLVAVRSEEGAAAEIRVVDRGGRVLDHIAPTDAAWEPIEAVEIRSRPRPQGQLSMIDPAGTAGHLLAIDARPPGPLGSKAASARLRLGGEGNRELGTVALARDGSFFARVPADVPLLLDLLDGDGDVLVEGLAPFWVRPKEIRGCIGCHEDPETAPPNSRPLAVLDEPVDLLGNES